MKMINNLKKTTCTLLIGMAMISSPVLADKGVGSVTAEELAVSAMPEINQDSPRINKSSGAFMLCFVDTPAWEVYTGPTCSSTGTAFSTVAAFKVFNLDPNLKVVWQRIGCPAYEPTLCILPIGSLASSTAVALIVNKNTGQVVDTISATATYYRELFR